MTERPDWQRAFEMLGTDGVDLIPILLAADGSMYAVLQGEYEGALHTVKLDSEGRLSAFVIDSTDAWGKMLSIGNAELAARFGALQRLDRRGNIQFVEDFSKGALSWSFGTWGTGAAAAIDPTTVLRGGYSVKLTAGDDGLHKARINRPIAYMPSSRVGAEVVFSLTGVTSQVFLWCMVYSGTKLYEVKVRYDCANTNLDIWDSGRDWTTVDASFELHPDNDLFHYLKVVWDMDTDTYVRVLVNGVETDLSAHALDASDLVHTPMMDLLFTNIGRVDVNDIVNLDSYVITNQEPE